MKQIIFMSSLLLYAAQFFAQNWKPLIINNKYNYQIDTLDYPSRTLWIDSVAINGSDSVFYLNRGLNYQGGFIIINNAHFLQKELLQTNNGIYILQNPDTFIIHTQDTLNSNWLFNPSRMITATLARLDTQTIFGSLDSIQILSLSNGDSVVLSKQFGLIYFPNLDNGTSWNLVGIEGRGLGIQIPKFNDFFGQLNVGDSIQYSTDDYAFGSYIANYHHRVTQKTTQQDTIEYHAIEYGIYYPDGNAAQVIYPHNVVYYYYNTPNHATNHYNQEILDGQTPLEELKRNGYAFFDTIKQDTNMLCQQPSNPNFVRVVTVTKDMNTGLWIKSLSSFLELYSNSDTLRAISYQTTCNAPDLPDYNLVSYLENIGLIYQGLNIGEYAYTRNLGAYYVNRPNDVLASGNWWTWTNIKPTQTETNQDWKLVQNPIQNHDIQLVATKNIDSETLLKIHNLQGELLHQQIFPMGQTVINVSLPTIPTGLYLATLANGQQLQVFKIIVP